MPKVKLAIGCILVTIEHERSGTRLEYRDLLLTIPSELFLSQNLSSGSLRSFSIVLYQNPRHFEENLLDRGVFIPPPANFWQSFVYFWAIPCSRVYENRDIFYSGEIVLSIRGTSGVQSLIKIST